MPCYDDRSARGETIYVDNPRDKEAVRQLTDKCSSLEAGLCAILNELESRGIAGEVAASASRHGLIDIMGFWNHHSKDDEARIAKSLHDNFSVDEQAVIRKLLKEDKE